MQLRFFAFPVLHGEELAAEINRFLSNHRILAVERHLIVDRPNSAWAICVGFDENASAGTPRAPIASRGWTHRDGHPVNAPGLSPPMPRPFRS
jgi:hypothetical protein